MLYSKQNWGNPYLLHYTITHLQCVRPSKSLNLPNLACESCLGCSYCYFVAHTKWCLSVQHVYSMHLRTHTTFNGHFSRWTWVSQLPLDFSFPLFLDRASSWTGPNSHQSSLDDPLSCSINVHHHPHSFVFPWSVESSPLQFLALA